MTGFSAHGMNRMIPIVATYLISLSVYALTVNGSNSKVICIAFIGLFISLMYATLTGEAFIADFDYANESERRGNTVLNSNQYAYFSLFAIMATRILIGTKDKMWAILKLFIYFILVFAACYTALMTASRQVLLLEIPLIAYYFYHDFLKEGKSSYKVLFIFVIIAIILYGAPLFLDYYNNSYLAIRAETEIDEDSRSRLMMTAINLGFEYPLLGAGLDADTTFSHCTYSHLFSRCGAFSVILYVYIIFNAIWQQKKRFKQTNNPYFNIIFVSMCLFALANFFYSYIDQPYMLPILFLLIGESDKIYNNSIN